MTQTQLDNLAAKIAKKYTKAESVRRCDVIRDVVRTRQLSLSDSIQLANAIVRGLYEAGKAVVVTPGVDEALQSISATRG